MISNNQTEQQKTDPTTTKKLPDSPSIFQRSNIGYPFIAGPTDGGGHWGQYHVVSKPDQNADPSTAAEEHLDLIDGYHVREKTQSGMSVTHDLVSGHNYEYVSGGHSHNKDGHSDIASGGNENRNIGLDRGSATANNGYEGHGGAITEGTGGSGNFENHTGGTKYITTSGDYVKQHDGNVHTNNTGDTVAAHTGNKYDIVQGDSGLNVQGGNYDVRVDSGKTQIYSGSDVIITSVTSITLNVGNQQIVINQSGVTINASQLQINQV